jgi:putative peptidoglycan lipid II flippase
VAALSLSVLVPAARLGLRWRPVLRIPPEALRRTRRLLLSALVAVGMEQVLLGLMLVFGNRVEGGVVAYQLAFTILELPWAILAVSIAVSAFPGLAGAAAREDREGFAGQCSTACRNLTVLAFGGVAGLLALAGPGSRLILDLGVGGGARSAHLLIPTVAAFAPGLIGYGGYALLTRVAYALGDGRTPALGALVGFGSATLLSFLAFLASAGAALIAGLAAAFSGGMTVAAVLMVVRLSASAGRTAFAGVGATIARGLTASAVAALAGVIAGRAIGGGGFGLVTAGAYLLVLHALGDRQLARAVAAVRSGSP